MIQLTPVTAAMWKVETGGLQFEASTGKKKDTPPSQ
jgi:hypothetical protein